MRLGVDTNGDTNIDQYVNPGAVPANAEWSRQRSGCASAPRTRSRLRDDTAYQYADMAAALTPNDKFRRILLSKTIHIRNTRAYDPPTLTARGWPATQAGAALVVGLILLLVLTLLAISGMTTASLELLMAGNEQYQERAFQAADAGVEQAIAAGVYNTNVAVGGYNNVAAIESGADSRHGQADCRTAPRSTRPTDAQQCEYFMRFDLQSGQTAVPGGGYSIGTGFDAYHFVVDSYGTSDRGAQSEHRQSFYIVGPGGA